MIRKRPWNTTEIKRLKASWSTTRPFQYAETFPGRTANALKQMASKLGLHKKYPKPAPKQRTAACWKKITDAHQFKTGYFDGRPQARQAARKPE